MQRKGGPCYNKKLMTAHFMGPRVKGGRGKLSDGDNRVAVVNKCACARPLRELQEHTYGRSGVTGAGCFRG